MDSERCECLPIYDMFINTNFHVQSMRWFYLLVGLLLLVVVAGAPVGYFAHLHGDIRSTLIFFFPVYSSPFVIAAIGFYARAAFIERPPSRSFRYAAFVHLGGVASLMLAILTESLPCAILKSVDAFCLVLSVPFLVASVALWIGGTTVLIWPSLFLVPSVQSRSK